MSQEASRRQIAAAPCAIRLMAERETEAVAALWHRTGRLAYSYLPAWRTMTPDTALGVFRNHIAAHCDVYVAERDGGLLGYLAMKGSYVDRLYVDPASQGHGVGTALVAHARQLSAAGVRAGRGVPLAAMTFTQCMLVVAAAVALAASATAAEPAAPHPPSPHRAPPSVRDLEQPPQRPEPIFPDLGTFSLTMPAIP